MRNSPQQEGGGGIGEGVGGGLRAARGVSETARFLGSAMAIAIAHRKRRAMSAH